MNERSWKRSSRTFYTQHGLLAHLDRLMQGFQSIPGLAGRLFGGAAAADLRRVQAQHGAASRCGRFSQAASAPPEAVKCPRCESTNTKFCYYNNYNLSQPRHFCKSCRRYWTKGGVLRNVPVGGGCRKAKRSASSVAPSTPTATDAKNQRRASAPSSSRSNSGSGSTSPTAAAATNTPPAPATPSSHTITFANRNMNPFAANVPPPAPIFADQAAALASLFSPPPPPPLPVFSFSSQTTKMEETIGSVLLTSQAPPEAPTPASTAADMTPFMSLDAGIFELSDTSTAAYWNAGSCWPDVPDPSIYLP